MMNTYILLAHVRPDPDTRYGQRRRRRRSACNKFDHTRTLYGGGGSGAIPVRQRRHTELACLDVLFGHTKRGRRARVPGVYIKRNLMKANTSHCDVHIKFRSIRSCACVRVCVCGFYLKLMRDVRIAPDLISFVEHGNSGKSIRSHTQSPQCSRFFLCVNTCI